MKATGIIRKVDELGRIVLPVELRRALSLEERSPIEIFVDGETVILKKYQPLESVEGKVKTLILIHGEEKVLAALEPLETK